MTKEALSSCDSSKSFDNSRHNQQIKNMFGAIAGGYDFLNHTLSMGFDIYWRRVLVASVAHVPDGILLDLAAGTFDVSLALARAYPRRKVLAADLCLPMLQQGLPKLYKYKRREGEAISCVTPLNADAYRLPLPDNSLSAITVSFGLRNMVPHVPALAEMRRVLMPGGRLSVLEFGTSRKRVWFGLYNFYLSSLLPRLGGLISGSRNAYDYLARTIHEFPTSDELADEMRAVGFGSVNNKRLSGGIVYVHSADK